MQIEHVVDTIAEHVVANSSCGVGSGILEVPCLRKRVVMGYIGNVDAYSRSTDAIPRLPRVFEGLVHYL